MENTTLKNLVKIYKDSQEFRKRSANRIRHCNTGRDIEEHVKTLENFDPDAQALDMARARRAGILSTLPENPTIEDLETILETELLTFLQNKENLETQIEIGEPFADTAADMIKTYKGIEKRIERKIKNQAASYPIFEWLDAQRGIGPIFSGSLIAYIGDISRFDTVSRLWQYAGMGVMDICQTCKKRHIPAGKKGEWILHTAERLQEQNDKLLDSSKKKSKDQLIKQAESMLCHCEHPDIKRMGQKRISGQLADYNPDFKKLCYLIGDQFIKQRESPYRKLYDQFRLEYENRPDLMKEMESRKGGQSKGTAHINAMARRKTVKIFLSHLWETWRKLENLPTPDPYSFAVLGHNDRIAPFDQE